MKKSNFKTNVIFLAFLFAISGNVFSAVNKSGKQNTGKQGKVKVVELVSDEGAFQTKDSECEIGNVKMYLKGSIGSFQFYTLNKRNAAVPVLAGYDDFTSSFFSVLAGKKEYRLTDNGGVIVGTRKSENGVQIVYVVRNVVRLFVKFDAMKSDENSAEDVIKVTAVMKNRGKTTETFALKNVLDTVFGERRGPHFSTAENPAINSEIQFRRFDKIKWIKSENMSAGMQILLSGANITSPEIVSLANKDFLALYSWVPSVVRSRGFDSLLSYNNSAVCMNWEEVSLAPDEEAAYVYYIALSSDGKSPRGEEFVAKLEKEILEKGVEDKYSIKEFEDAYQKATELAEAGDYSGAMDVVLELWSNPDNRNARLESLKNYIEEQMDYSTASDFEKQIEEMNIQDGEDAGVPVSDPLPPKPVVPPLENVYSDGLDYTYVRELIDRIYALESSDIIDRNEILRLNAELDAIIEKLRER